MPIQVKITINNITVEAEFFDTACAKAIGEKLPLEAVPNEWGDEFYFEIPVISPLDETATRAVKIGDIGYWPPGQALAVFFGPTPLSSGLDPVPASEVNIVGKIAGDVTLLRKAKGASTIRLEKAQ
jgi:uncharacterized protein